MAEFKFRCPYCLQKLKADEEWRGELTECPHCHKRYNIPEKVAAPGDADDGGNSESPKPSSDELRRRLRSGADAAKTFLHSFATGSLRRLRSGAAAAKTFLCSIVTALMNFIRKNREEIATAGKFLLRCALTVFIIYLMIVMGRNLSCGSGNGAPAAKPPAPAASAAPPAPAAPPPAPVAYRPPRVEYREPRRILVHVTVRKKYTVWDECYKYNCEYKLYADDVCIATKNSRSTMVTFNARVPEGAALRAEMLGKNGFGGVADSISGPNFGEKQPVASREGQYITIDCW